LPRPRRFHPRGVTLIEPARFYTSGLCKRVDCYTAVLETRAYSSRSRQAILLPVPKTRLRSWLESATFAFWGPILARLAVAAIGTAMIVVGLHGAWNANTSTTALIVGGILVALALLFSPDLEELSARWKDAGLTYRKREREELVRISEGVEMLSLEIGSAREEELETGEDDATRAVRETAWQAQLQQFAERLEAQAHAQEQEDAVAARARRSWLDKWRNSWSQQPISTAPDSAPQPMYSLFFEDGAWHIHASFSGWVYDWRLNCAVIAPQGVSSRVIYGRLGVGTIHYSIRYPDDFDAPPIVPGTYTFRWARVGPASSKHPESDRLLLADELFLAPELFDEKEGTRSVIPRRIYTAEFN
jgi:hypothetical protein